MKRTVMIDDTKEVANRNSKNLIHVSKFKWSNKKSDEDATLLKVLSVLQQIKDLPDWTKFKKSI
jgi:hypothetical protein